MLDLKLTINALFTAVLYQPYKYYSTNQWNSYHQ